ncbi:MAG: DNA repair protein RadC [Myxococcales bacterium]|nr:DNA repair protein RadC [Myxococcales bacterium]
MIDHDTADNAPREGSDEPLARLRNHGPEALSEAELLGVLLEHGRTHAASSRYAARVLDAYGGARSLARAGFGELAIDLGAKRALRFMAAIELSRRALSEPLRAGVPLRSSRDVHRAFEARVAELPDEVVLAVLLDVKQRPVAERMIARGSPAGCAVSVREVFALAVREAAVGIVLVHNHPSGDPTPSEADRAITDELVRAGLVLGLPLVDHVIVARSKAFSFLDAGLLGDARMEQP